MEVLKDILELLGKGKELKITHLVYKANLSSNSIKSYMDYLIENNLIEQINNKKRNTFTITPRGMAFLKEFEKIRIFSESYGLNKF